MNPNPAPGLLTPARCERLIASPAAGCATRQRVGCARLRRAAAIALAVLALQPPPSGAHETDQYTLPLGREFAELRGHFSRVAYRAIVDAVSGTNSAIKDSLSTQPTAEIERLQSADFIAGEVWGNLFAALPTNEGFDAGLAGDAMRARFPGLVVVYKPEQFIYDDPLLVLDITKVVRTFFRSGTVNMNGTLFGTDKFLHFVHMGRIYHSKFLGARGDGLTEEAAVARAISATGSNPFLSEKGLLGGVTTGIRSNADLAADYAGLKFYRNLTESVRIGETVLPPMLEKEGVYWRLGRRVRPGSDFFAVFITPHFNEALNPNSYAALMGTRVRKMLRARCFDLLDWYRDERGRPRSREQFAAIEQELSTFYGEPYGHESDGESRVSIATTCFEPDGSRAPGAAPAREAAVAQSAWTQWPGSDRFGRTELWWAAREGHVDAVKRLIAQVENPNALDLDDEGPLHAAARGGHATVVELLIAHGADPRARSRYGATPLHVSVAASHPQTAEALLRNGSDVNARDMFGMMPLHQAILAGDRELAALLLDHGANRAALYRKSTPAQLAALAGNETLAKWLTSYRTNPATKSGSPAPPRKAARPQVAS